VPFLVTVAWTAVQTPRVIAGEPPSVSSSWVPQLGLDLSFRLDGIGLIMTWLVAGVGVLVMVYAWGSFGSSHSDLGRFAGSMVPFGGALCGVLVPKPARTVHLLGAHLDQLLRFDRIR
jgi:multicomponent Na+:H+ antiporter subunit A